jgi:hypothetical protein
MDLMVWQSMAPKIIRAIFRAATTSCLLLHLGRKNYMCCMIETSNCKLMMFLPDGTPVRASVDLALREVDLGVASRKFSKRQKFTPSGG